jgi:hypothetical protein
MQKINKFNEFINEASLRGNIGIPGEEGSGRESWLDKTTARSDRAANEFMMANRADIQGFMGMVMKSQQLQEGHEEELSELTIAAFRELYGSLLDDIELDFKISTRGEVAQSMEETPTESEMPEVEELADQDLINQVHKRKILRTIQQGKGLSAKAILNLSIFKNGLIEILGQAKAAEYLTLLNKISNVAQFFDWDVPEQMQKQMWQNRQGFSGSCDIQFGKEAEDKDEIAQKVLDDLANGEDIVDNEDVEELVSGLDITIIARGVDLSVLIHEAIKAVYKLPTQASLEALSDESAEKVLMNTDTLFDELQELKFGRQMQTVFFKQVAEHPIVVERINSMLRQDASDVEISAFQEKLNWLFFGKLSQIGVEDAREFLTLVNAILMESAEAQELCDPIIKSVIRDLAQEEEYQAQKRGETPRYAMPTEIAPEIETSRPSDMSTSEIEAAIDDALDAGDFEEVDRLRKMLGESYRFPRLSLASILFERKK